jgi:uncharacterized protein
MTTRDPLLARIGRFLLERFGRPTPPAPKQPAPTKPVTSALAMFVEDVNRDPYRHKIVMPAVPRAVLGGKERPPAMAMDDGGGFPFGNFLNTNTIAGLNFFGLYFPGYPYLAELAQRSEFRQPVETTAKEMTRKWIAFKSRGEGDKSDRIEQIETAFEEFKVQSIFRKATEHDGFYGLGHVYIDIDGHEDDRANPLIIDSATIPKGSLRGLQNIEPMWTTPLVWNSTDPTKPTFYKPDTWMVLAVATHQSRMLRFASREIPDIIKPAYNFGGLSLTQLIQPYVDRWLKTVDGVNRLINNFSIIFLQTDMAALLEGNFGGVEGGKLLERAKLFQKFRDNQGLFLTDKNMEDLKQLAVPLSGLSELQAQAQEHMAAPTHLPLVVLTGITPAGLNASSDSEIEVFHDWIHSSQESLYRDPLTKVLNIVQLHLFGNVDPDVTFDFIPLKQLTGEALSRVKKTQSEMDIAYIDGGVVSPEEVRERVGADPDSGYDNLSGPAPEPVLDPELDPNAEDDDEPQPARAHG